MNKNRNLRRTLQRILQNIRPGLVPGLILCMLLGASLTGCGGDSKAPKPGGTDEEQTAEEESGPVRDNTPQVLVPSADGTVTYTAENIIIDASHTDQGYVMVQYAGTLDKEKLQIDTPDGSTYTYELSTDGSYDVMPLTCGNGTYSISVYENVEGDMYALVTTQDIAVTVSDEYLPYLYPNQYVEFTVDTKTVAKAQELADGVHSDISFVENVFYYIAQNITYDNEKAASVSYDYLPNVDDTLASGKGICFDYAALMAAMLRSQGIPTKLQIGYVGDVYHAWISTYVDESGWVDKIIEFDGVSWVLIDPTYAAGSGGTEAVNGSADNYKVNYTY